MADRNLVIILVTATVFVGLVAGWVAGAFGEGMVGGTETFGFAAGAFLLVVVLTFAWFIVTDSFGEPD
ncbi:hypothetical protein [Halostagnicola sp. A-GB9-2]|uniref:hypothetical protein n=1 Tax=Halostagnicola sp. A-GB9-2 TaxID=3048066 RepID=UPI0024BFB2FC|nr:hypothetical protein [Halostagnicola sp. A-GB9-2]MDJ1432344.1 hypothetical protein [Halostagnicola sp. A-GB9-2]